MLAILSACSAKEKVTESDNGKINVVATIFPEYDFVRQIAGDRVNLSMLLAPGMESHSFEPSPQDILKIQDSDMFIYVGGDSDEWVSDILASVDQSHMTIISLMDCVKLEEEEIVEGMEPEEEQEEDKVEGEQGEELEMDEHVWTSPKNAIAIVQKLCAQLCNIDPKNADEYRNNAENYISKLRKLDQEFQDVVDHGVRKEIIVADRFPFRYFVRDYGLTYYAAFPGCSTETEASAATVAFLIDKVKSDNIPIVFHVELSNEQMCDSIGSATGAKKELLNAAHNISKEDFNRGVTYLDLMEHNVQVLKEALN
jgi:zinc transport system substrate-binding protein